MSAATAGLVWAGIEWLKFRRVSMVGLVTGVVAGLATVTPASGFVGPLGGMILGAAGSIICYHAVELVRHIIRIDDSLDVFAVHGVGGVLGTLIVPFLADPDLGGAGFAPGMTVMRQFGVQALGVAVVCALSAVMTLILFELINRTIGMRVSDDVIDEGLDMASHGEKAYRTTT
jgi:Amt family ammonium transporter